MAFSLKLAEITGACRNNNIWGINSRSSPIFEERYLFKRNQKRVAEELQERIDEDVENFRKFAYSIRERMKYNTRKS